MLVDSTIYIDLLRRGEDVPFVLKALLLSEQLFICGVIRAEVLRGIRTIEMRNELSDLFDLMTEVPTDARIWAKMTDLAWKLDRRGVVLPSTDLVIACCGYRGRHDRSALLANPRLESEEDLGLNYLNVAKIRRTETNAHAPVRRNADTTLDLTSQMISAELL